MATTPTMKVALLAGDGIGPEIMAMAEKLLTALQSQGLPLETTSGLIGGAAYERHGQPLPAATLKIAREADAVLLGAVGGPQYDHLERALRPESGLLQLRQALEVFANLRPVRFYPPLARLSTLKTEVVSGLDIMIVRELTGDLYFGKPRGIHTDKDGQRIGTNTMTYTEAEIRRIAEVGFEAAAGRQGRLCSVDKANVLETSELWRSVVGEVAQRYPQVKLTHMYVDNAAMQLVRDPKQFDVILTSNLFGDILSDEAAMIPGTIGLLPSASLDAHSKGLYEPIHGSAPDIAGKDRANPLGMILSVAMMLRYSFRQEAAAKAVEVAVERVLRSGLRTPDMLTPLCQEVGTADIGEAVIERLAGS